MPKAPRRAVLEVLWDVGGFQTVETIKETLVSDFQDEGDVPPAFMRDPDGYVQAGLNDLVGVGFVTKTGLSYSLNQKGIDQGKRLLGDQYRYAPQVDDGDRQISTANWHRGHHGSGMFPRGLGEK